MQIVDQVNPFDTLVPGRITVKHVILTGDPTPVKDAHAGQLRVFIKASEMGLCQDGEPAWKLFDHGEGHAWAQEEFEAGWSKVSVTTSIMQAALILLPSPHQKRQPVFAM
jgi:hypothetical protein